MTNNRLELVTINDSEIAANVVSEPISLDTSVGFCLVTQKIDSVLINKTFSSVSLNAISILGHGYKTGLKVRFTTSGTLPTGLLLATDYFLIKVSDDILMIANSQEASLEGFFLTISGGSGTHTIAVEANSPCFVKLQGSVDNIVWFDIGDSLQEIKEIPTYVEHETAFFHYLRCSIINESGQRQIYSKIMIKGF
jgi:hypothetical protein